MVTAISQFPRWSKSHLIIFSVVMTAINQIGIRVLKTQTFEAIRKLPSLSPINLVNSTTISKGITHYKDRNQNIIDLISLQNRYKLYSFLASCAIASFSIYYSLFPLNYCTPIIASLDWSHVSSNHSFITSLKTKCFPITKRLSKQALDNRYSWSEILVGKNLVIQYKKCWANIDKSHLDDIEATTNCTSVFNKDPSFKISYTEKDLPYFFK